MVIRFQEKSNCTWRFAFFSINWCKPWILPNTHKSATFSPLKEKECSSSPLRGLASRLASRELALVAAGKAHPRKCFRPLDNPVRYVALPTGNTGIFDL